MHHPCTCACKLQHFIIADRFNLSGIRDNSWIGCVNPIHIRKYIAGNFQLRPRRIMLHHRSKCHCSSIRTTSAQSGNIIVFINTLKTSNDDNIAIFQGFAHSSCGDTFNSRLGMGAIGNDSDLGPGKAYGSLTQRLDRHGHQ